MLNDNDVCLCCSGKLAAECCLPLLSEKIKAKTPVALMRSRFSAYALGGYGAYLLKTWLPINRTGLDKHTLSQRSINWSRLEIISKSRHGKKGMVEFNAYYFDNNFKEACHYEKSKFEHVEGQWYYVGS